jgi:thiamine monophosphate kinase
LLHPLAAGLSAATHLPAFPFLASYHGEFELVFTVPPVHIAELERRASEAGWQPLRVGIVESTPGVRFGDVEVDTAALRNAFELAGGDARKYVDTLLRVSVP